MLKRYRKRRKLEESLTNAINLKRYYEDEISIYRHNYSPFSIYVMIGELVRLEESIEYIKEELYK